MSSVVKVGPHMGNVCMDHHFGRQIALDLQIMDLVWSQQYFFYVDKEYS